MATNGPLEAAAAARRLVDARGWPEEDSRDQWGVVNELASSQTTAKPAMADGERSTVDRTSYYCTLPRPARRDPAVEASAPASADRNRTNESRNQGQFHTLRTVGRRTSAQSPATSAVVAPMGNVPGAGRTMFGTAGTRLSAPQPEDDHSEATRNLLYEQNMCTFEDFCQQEGRHRTGASERDTGDGEPWANFCTLRRGRGSRGCTDGDERQPLGGDYCTLKKKKLQLDRTFVESFLEDPNAQVADYLSELDAYLDEMDGVDDEARPDAGEGEGGAPSDDGCSSGSSSSREIVHVNEAHAGRSASDDPSRGEADCSQSLQYYHQTGQGCPRTDARDTPPRPAGECQDDRIQFGDIKHFCTLPKQKRTQFLNAFKRAASLRRTFADERVPSDGGNVSQAGRGRGAESSDFNGDANGTPSVRSKYGQSSGEDPSRDQQRHHHHLHPSWHRHSMRRQHLIELPEQHDEYGETGSFPSETGPLVAPPLAGGSGESLTSGDSANHTLDDTRASRSSLGNVSDEPNEFSSISTLPVGEVPPAAAPSAPLDVGVGQGAPAAGLVVALPPSPVPFGVARELIAASAPPLSASPPPPPLETDLDGDGLVETRPRQTGRRAQSQPRIGSITVERDEATNELIIRTNSGGMPILASSLSVEGHFGTGPRQQQQQQHQQRPQDPPPPPSSHHHHRYGPAESEGSSMGSSRNPSPVSLLSTTTTYSSIASATENGADHRAHQAASELPRDGTEGRGPSAAAAEEVASIRGYHASASSRRIRTVSGGGGVERHARSSSQGADTSSVAVGTAGTDDTPEEESDPEIGAHARSSRRNDGRPKARWPHAISRPLATTFCTLGLFNLSRFAVFSVHFGANFVVQFLIFSLFFGIPMMWLQMVLGARIRGGPVTMWRVSPICKGIGIALLLAQALVTLYSAVSLAWVLVYFRDAFVVHNEKYRWQEPFEAYRGAGQDNQSHRLPDTVADYFNGVVLQRYHLIFQAAPTGAFGGRVLPRGTGGGSGIGAIRFQLAFNMAILWTLVFVALCRGIRSLGKVVIGLFLLAVPALVAVCTKLLTFISYDSVQSVFPATDWQDFFLNARSWTCAAQETFLTWGLLGVSIYALNCRSNRKGSGNVRTRRELRRDAFLVALITLSVLILAGVLGSACVQILSSKGYYYSPGSYENLGTNVFLRYGNQPLPPQHGTLSPHRWFTRYSTVVGESFKRSRDDPESGYQVLRLVTELLPAALAAATPERIQPIWGLVAFLALLLFGVGQLCVMWKPIAGAIGDAPSSILLSCVTGLLLGMPLATEGGINIVHYLDTILGAAWWVLLLWIGHILALFLVRGRPFTSDILVNDLLVLQSFSAFVAFAWNFLLPIGLIFLCIIQYRLSNSAALFNWPSTGPGTGASGYWPLWARQVGGFVQVSFLLLVPIVMVVQIYRYLCSGPPDILDRVDLLLRPPVDGDTSNPIRATQSRRRPAPASLPQGNAGGARTSTSATQQRADGTSEQTISLSLDSRAARDADDAPPKYTPPPSYTTATGARIAKMLRNSIRRSVRRIMGESSGVGGGGGGAMVVGLSRQRAALPQTTAIDPCDSLHGANPASGGELPPPDYCSALQQFGAPPGMEGAAAVDLARPPRVLYNSATLGSGRRNRSLIGTGPGHASPEQRQQQTQPTLTASDVRQILRPATVGGDHLQPVGAPGFTQTLRNTLLLRRGHSMENLVLAAAPIGDSSIITLNEGDVPGAAGGRDSVI